MNSSASEVSKGRARHPQPIVQGVLGPADRRGRAVRQPCRNFECLVLQLVFVDAQRHEADALRLLSAQRLAQQQMIFRFGETAQQRPDNSSMIAGGDAEASMTIVQRS